MRKLPGTRGRQNDQLNESPAHDARVSGLRLVAEFGLTFLQRCQLALDPVPSNKCYAGKDCKRGLSAIIDTTNVAIGMGKRKKVNLPAGTPAPDEYHVTGCSDHGRAEQCP